MRIKFFRRVFLEHQINADKVAPFFNVVLATIDNETESKRQGQAKMCGVGALLSRNGEPVNHQELSWMMNLMRHRGPDGQGIVTVNNGLLGMVHTRLAINDQANGHQPMRDEQAQLVISYNGEIYDCDALRKQLRQRGFQFTTKTDTEVVLKLYQAYGLDMFKHMNGEFAFVLWDEKNKRLLAGRDRFGIKPLYLLETGATLAFASEIKPLLVLDRVPFQASHHYLLSSFMGSFIGHESFFRGIRALKPGHYLKLDDYGISESPYWQADFSQKVSVSFNDAKAELACLLKKAVDRRLVADTEVGCFLSGGVDSTIVAALAAQTKPRFKSFSIGFHGEGFDESTVAKQSADMLGLDASILMADKPALTRGLIKSLKHIEIPMVTPLPVGMVLLSQHIRNAGIKACLSGDGADELFAGYPYFKLDQLRALERKQGGINAELAEQYRRFYNKEQPNKVMLWFPSRNWHKHIFQDSECEREYISSYIIRERSTLGYRRRLFSASVNAGQALMQEQTSEFYQSLSKYAHNGVDFNRALSKQQLTNYIFPVQGDRVQMSHSVEARVPFLDNDVVSFAQSLPPEYLMDMKRLQEKHILHESFKDSLPAHMHYRHKQAYHSGYSWDDFSKDKEGRRIWKHYLNYSHIKQSGLFDPLFVKGLQQVNRLAPSHSSIKCKTDMLLGNVFSSLVLLDQLNPQNLQREAQAVC